MKKAEEYFNSQNCQVIYGEFGYEIHLNRHELYEIIKQVQIDVLNDIIKITKDVNDKFENNLNK